MLKNYQASLLLRLFYIVGGLWQEVRLVVGESDCNPKQASPRAAETFGPSSMWDFRKHDHTQYNAQNMSFVWLYVTRDEWIKVPTIHRIASEIPASHRRQRERPVTDYIFDSNLMRFYPIRLLSARQYHVISYRLSYRINLSQLSGSARIAAESKKQYFLIK
jgi:hypothetical protein